jgi:methylmalonyl-CoA/ethylmalonyl-CoA epimerase
VILGIDHVGIAVGEGEAGAADFARLTRWPAGALETVAGQDVRVCFIPNPLTRGGEAGAATRIELLEPTAEDSAVGRFLSRRGEGLHHVCFAVDDVAAELVRLTGEGYEAIDPVPRRGHGGLVAFLHPRSTHGVLVELLQRDPPPSPADPGAGA